LLPKPRRLTIQYDLILSPVAPFHFDGTVYKPSHFPSGDCMYEDGQYWQTMRFDDRVLGIRLLNMGSVDRPKVALSIFSSKQISEALLFHIKSEIEYRFDMNIDLKEFYDTCKRDSVLKPVIKRWKGMRVSNGRSLYEFLVIATVLQNATVRRSAQMLENLFEHYGAKVNYDGKTLSSFWLPKSIDQASENELRNLKLGYRAKIFKHQSYAFMSGKLDESQLRLLNTDALKSRLLELYGVGPASVWYVLFEVFKRYNAFEYISPWEQKIYSHILYNRDMVEAKVILDDVNSKWGKWKMLAIHYLFEDLFWQRKKQHIPWLDGLIRL